MFRNLTIHLKKRSPKRDLGVKILRESGSTSSERDLALQNPKRAGATSPKRDLTLQVPREIWRYKSQERYGAKNT